MKFSERWLREWVNPPVDSHQLAQCLTMAGLEVDEVAVVSPPLDKVLVGHVTDIQPHPDADRLRVCTVDVGEPEALNIVCGAANVAKGMRVPVATVGAKLPIGLKIKKSKIRGVASQGMICSEAELGLAEQSDGIMDLPDSAAVGTPIFDYLLFHDVSIDVDLTPNRGDCLSVRGIARDVSAIADVPIEPFKVAECAAQHDSTFAVELGEPAACANYVGRVICGIDFKQQSPLWLKEKLRRSGLRSLGPVVDVTNYVMLELGQPMHAFDLAQLSGGIRVRFAHAGESLVLLNGDTVELDSETLVIADDEQVLALAGIMGGLNSAVSESTTDVFLESAWFSPAALAGKARKFGLATDSSHRFERGVDPDIQVLAIHRATELLVDIVGGEPGPLTIATSQAHLPRPESILLRPQRIEAILGVSLEHEQIERILNRLGMTIERESQGWRVLPPSYRFDIRLEVDLIEEIGRIYGYENIPNELASVHPVMLSQSDARTSEQRLAAALVDRGYQEVVTYSFVEPELQALFDPDHDPVTLLNPLSLDQSAMRTTQLIGLVKTLMFNRNRQQSRVRLFETGLSFVPETNGLIQERLISGLVCGPLNQEQPQLRPEEVDFYDIKADVESLLWLTGESESFSFTAAEHHAMHPGQCAEVKKQGQAVGHLGRLHPGIESKLNLGVAVYVFELRLEPLLQRSIPAYQEVSKFPQNRRDLAFLVDKAVAAGDIVDHVRRSARPTLQSVVVFDVYEGEGVEVGKKSLALGLTLSDTSRTLTDDDIDKIVNNVILDLAEKYQARLRD